MDFRLHILFGLSAADALAGALLPADHPDVLCGLSPGEAGTDTQLVIATLDGYKKRNVLRGLVEWAWSDPADIGVQTQRALRREVPWGGMVAWMESGGVAAGQEGLSCAPAPLIAGATGEFLLHEAVYTTALTHPDPRCLYASALLAALLEELSRRGESGAHQRAWNRVSHLNLSAITEARGLHPENNTEALKAKHLIRRRSEEARGQVQARMEAALQGDSGPQTGSALDTLQSVLAHAQAGSFLEGVQANITSGARGAALTGSLLAARGLSIPPALTTDLRAGHTWKAWKREWPCEQHYPATVPGSGESPS